MVINLLLNGMILQVVLFHIGCRLDSSLQDQVVSSKTSLRYVVTAL